MNTRVLVIGAGGSGRDVLDIIEALNSMHSSDEIEVVGIADDNPKPINLERLSVRGYQYLGPIDTAIKSRTLDKYVLGIGFPHVKAALAARIEEHGLEPLTLIHPSVEIVSECRIGDGVILFSGVQLSTNVTLKRHVHLNKNVFVGHDVVLDDYVSVNPNATIAGETRIGCTTLIGAGAVVLQNLEIASNVTIGASSCVTKTIESPGIWMGVPARIYRH